MLSRLIFRRAMNIFIQTKKTPNPDFLKFLPGSHSVMGSEETIDIASEEAAIKTSNLARKLFKVEGVTRVFYGPNYISIAKKP